MATIPKSTRTESTFHVSKEITLVISEARNIPKEQTETHLVIYQSRMFSVGGITLTLEEFKSIHNTLAELKIV